MGRAIDRTGLGAARWGVLVLCALAASQAAVAQEALVAAPVPVEATVATLPIAAPATPPGTPQCPPTIADAAPCIPALTPVRIAIKAHLGSKISLGGQTFPIELAQPIVVDGRELLPAGTAGMGEVVHAKKSGGSGASGELILAARYLEVGGKRLRLRSLNFAQAGEDKIGTAIVASMVLSFAGFLVKGKGIDVPEGAEAWAKTAELFVLDPPAPAPVSPPPEQGTTS
jgi:hypothetical protein